MKSPRCPRTGFQLPLAQPAPASRVVLSEPMLRYRCNQKGCCCRGWDIPFKLDDFIRLFEHLPEKERGELGAGLQLMVDEAPPEEKVDLILKSLKLAGVGEDRHCRFLEGSGGCSVHAKHGISALPDICVDFPAHGFRDEASGEVELYWDPVCPEVVRMFAEETESLRTGLGRDAHFRGRASVTRDLLSMMPRVARTPGRRAPGVARTSRGHDRARAAHGGAASFPENCRPRWAGTIPGLPSESPMRTNRCSRTSTASP